MTAPNTSAGAYDLRHPGLIRKDGNSEVHEFMGMGLSSPMPTSWSIGSTRKTRQYRWTRINTMA